MLGMARTHEPRLVLRFALASLLVFLVVGIAAMVLLVRSARDRAERAGAEHATFVADAVLAPTLEGMDLSEPVTGTDYARVLEVVRERVLSDGRDVRVKVWSPDGTIVFAVEPDGWPRDRNVVRTAFGRVALTHWNLNDGTLEGMRCLDVPALAVQYHPEAAPGPHDARHLFDEFRALMAAA